MIRIQRSKPGLWYLYQEGKVRQEWVHEVCGRVGVNVDTLEPNVWYDIPEPDCLEDDIDLGAQKVVLPVRD